jgi:hypothetical protein
MRILVVIVMVILCGEAKAADRGAGLFERLELST